MGEGEDEYRVYDCILLDGFFFYIYESQIEYVFVIMDLIDEWLVLIIQTGKDD